MKSEDKWKDAKLVKHSSELEEDNTLGMSRNDSPLTKWLVAGAVAAGGVLAYKSGALRHGISKAIEYGDNYKPFVDGSRKAFKQWLKKEHWDEIDDVLAPQLSLLRAKGKGPKEAFKKAMKSDKTVIEILGDEHALKKLATDKVYRQHVLSDTKRDIQDLRSMVRKKMKENTIETSKRPPKEFGQNTKFMNSLREMTKTTVELNRMGHSDFSKQAYNTMAGEMLKHQTQTKKQAATKLKRTGYRNLTLGDVFDLDDKGKLQIKANQKGQWDIDASIIGDIKTINKFDFDKGKEVTVRGKEARKEFKRRLSQFDQLTEDFLNAEVKVNNEFKKLGETDLWKDIVIDSNLMINQKGRIVDTRGASKELNSFVHSLSTNYQIPILGINPLRLFGVGNNYYKKESFGMLGRNTVNPMLTKQAGHYKTVGQSFGSSLFFAYDKVYQFDGTEKLAKEVGRGFEFHNMTKMANRKFGMTAPLDGLHNVADLSYKIHEDFDVKEDGWLKATWGKVSKKLDLGRQDKAPDGGFETDGLYKYLNPDHYADQLFEKVGSKIKTVKSSSSSFEFNPQMFYDPAAQRDMRGVTPNMTNIYGFSGEDNRHFVAIKKMFTPKDVFDQDSDVTLDMFFKQFIAGRHKDGTIDDAVTSASLYIFDTVNKASSALTPFNLDLSTKSKGSVIDLTANMLLKRALPVYGAYMSYEYLNYMTEWDSTGDGEKDMNITKAVAKGIKDIDVGLHVWKDQFGITDLQKDIKRLTPGLEVSILNDVDFGLTANTAEEQLNWYEDGVSEVRKGRWWGLGNTPWTGGKIEYFQPNWYRRTMADVRFSDSLYGSREEFFKHHWLPNPSNPIAPITYLLHDKYHYDIKHRYDRPYLTTSGLFNNIPFFGPGLEMTVGNILKPRISLHDEAWDKIATTTHQATQLQKRREEEQAEIDFAMTSAQGQLEASYTSPSSDVFSEGSSPGLPTPLSGTYGESGFNIDRGKLTKDTEVLNAYVTQSGSVSVVGMRADENLYDINQRLSKYSLTKLTKINQRPDVAGVVNSMGQIELTTTDKNPHAAFSQTYDQITNLQGMRGFMLNGMMLGPMDSNKQLIETSDYAYSFNRAFWDSNIGGAGGGLMEIVRRFIPGRRSDVEWINPIRNNMPDWLPGEDYFTDFLHGDPYTKVAKGEMRLPGQGYERLYGLEDVARLEIDDSLLGKSQNEYLRHFYKQDVTRDIGFKELTKLNQDLESRVMSYVRNYGVVVDSDGEVGNRQLGISGTYDLLLQNEMSPEGYSLMNVKAVSHEEYQRIKLMLEPQKEHVAQLNFQLSEMGLSKGYISYVDRDNPFDDVLTLNVSQDNKMYERSVKDLLEARGVVNKQLASGEINQGALYDHIDRLRILADIAPYSNEYTEQKALVSSMDLTEEERAKVREITSRVTEQKEPLRITPYRFKTAEVKKETVTIVKVLDNDKFLTLEHLNNPIKLAGINVKNMENWDKTNTSDVVSDYLRPGMRVQIAYDKDPANETSDDSLGTIRASVSHHGVNINRALVKEGVAEFKEDDYSAASVHARFDATERAIGSLWESFAHLHTPFHTKFLQVRSGLESYKRREVYGKNFQQWTNPIDDFLKPMVRENVERGLIPGVLMGAFLGSLFGAKGNTYGKVMGATIGASTYLAGKTVTTFHELRTNQKWIPKVREKERELEKYIDILKYVKNRRLYQHYSELALKEDKFDVEKYIKSNEYSGKKNKKKIERLENQKKRLKLTLGNKNLSILGQNIDTDVLTSKRIKSLTAKINELKGTRRVDRLSDNAIKAIHYYNESEKTMYGYDPGEPLTNLLAALPKKDRQYMKYFMDAPEKERAEILKVVPDYMRRPLAATWGYGAPKKESLEDYFTTHALPDEDWSGWQEDVSLDDVRVKMIKKAGLDFSEFDVWDDQVDSANQAGYIALPKINKNSNPQVVAARLKAMLTEQGLDNVRVEVARSSSRSRATMKVVHDSHHDVEQTLRDYEFLD